jgi:hypothetical protein
MSTKYILTSIRFALALAAGLSASSALAVGTITASATLSDVQNGTTYDYTLTLDNTGTIPIESFWYGWTTSGNNLPSDPTTPGNSLGWNNTLDANSIKFTGSSGDSLEPANFATFTFDSTSTPAQITAGISGESVAYAGAIDFTENTPGDSSPVFAPVEVPEPSTLGLFVAGLLGLSSAGCRAGRGLILPRRRPRRRCLCP